MLIILILFIFAFLNYCGLPVVLLSNLPRLAALTRRCHRNVIGTPTEYNLGLIVLLSSNKKRVILLSVL